MIISFDILQNSIFVEDNKDRPKKTPSVTSIDATAHCK